MNPLSPLLYIKRNIKRVSITIISIMLAVFITYFFYLTVETTSYSLNNQNIENKCDIIVSTSNKKIPKELLSSIEEKKEYLIPYKDIVGDIRYKRGMGNNNISVLSLFREDSNDFMKMLDIKIVEGSLPNEEEDGIIINKKVALQNNLKVGDIIDKETNNIILKGKWKVTGLYEGECLTAFVNSKIEDEKNEDRGVCLNHLILYKSKDNSFKNLSENEKYEDINIFDKSSSDEEMEGVISAMNMFKSTLGILLASILCIALGNLNYINFYKREKEMFILNAIGYKKSKLIFKVYKENFISCITGYILGIILTILIVSIMNIIVFSPQGADFIYYSLGGMLNSLLIPFIVSIFSVLPCICSKAFKNSIK